MIGILFTSRRNDYSHPLGTVIHIVGIIIHFSRNTHSCAVSAADMPWPVSNHTEHFGEKSLELRPFRSRSNHRSSATPQREPSARLIWPRHPVRRPEQPDHYCGLATINRFVNRKFHARMDRAEPSSSLGKQGSSHSMGQSPNYRRSASTTRRYSPSECTDLKAFSSDARTTGIEPWRSAASMSSEAFSHRNRCAPRFRLRQLPSQERLTGF